MAWSDFFASHTPQVQSSTYAAYKITPQEAKYILDHMPPLEVIRVQQQQYHQAHGHSGWWPLSPDAVHTFTCYVPMQVACGAIKVRVEGQELEVKNGEWWMITPRRIVADKPVQTPFVKPGQQVPVEAVGEMPILEVVIPRGVRQVVIKFCD